MRRRGVVSRGYAFVVEDGVGSELEVVGEIVEVGEENRCLGFVFGTFESEIECIDSVLSRLWKFRGETRGPVLVDEELHAVGLWCFARRDGDFLFSGRRGVSSRCSGSPVS